MKKRIVFVFRNMGAGGAQKIEAFVANALYEQGYEIVAINMSPEEKTVNINKKIQVVDLYYDDILKEKNILLRTIKKKTYLDKLKKEIVKINPDAVVSFLCDVVRITVLALKGNHIPIIGSERGDPFILSQKRFEKYRKAYCACRGVVFQLPNVKKKYNLPEEVFQKIIANPCVPRKDNFVKRNDNDSHIILSAGRMCRQKRFDVLIDAFNEVYKKYPEYRLIIYGDGPLRGKLIEKVQTMESKYAIEFPGSVENVFGISYNAEMFVLSSDYEGIPNVLLEAMATGIPCVSTDCSPGGASFILKNGELGLISPCGDSHALAENMIELIKDAPLRNRMGLRGMSVIDEYNEDTIKRQWLDFFYNLGI